VIIRRVRARASAGAPKCVCTRVKWLQGRPLLFGRKRTTTRIRKKARARVYEKLYGHGGGSMTSVAGNHGFGHLTCYYAHVRIPYINIRFFFYSSFEGK
jgi:hypothetical protein